MLYYLRLIYLHFKRLVTGPFKWFAILFLVWLYRVEFMPDTGVGMAKILQVGTIFGLLFLLLKRQPNLFQRMMRRTNAPVKSVALLYIYAILSSLWAFLPPFSFFLSFQNLVMIMLFTWIFSLYRNFYDIERAFLFFTVIIVIMEFIVTRTTNFSLFNHFLPGGSISAMMLSYCVGEHIHSNKREKQRRSLLRVCCLFFLMVVILNTSGGANASVVVAIGVAMFLGGKKGYALMIILIGFYLALNQELIDDVILTLLPGKDMKTIEIGNGRDYIWERILYYANQRPWFGWGFACAERVDQEIFGGQSLSDAHSNYVGMYGSLGIVGCLLFGWHLLQTGLHLFKRINYPGFLGLFAAFTCATVNGYSYGFLSGKTCSITVAYIMVVVLSFYYDKCRMNA